MEDTLNNIKNTRVKGDTFWYRAVHNALFVAGASVVLFFVVIAMLAPIISPYNPFESDANYIKEGRALRPPNAKHPFGTDMIGRDVLSRMIYGTRISISVGIISTGIAVVIGTIIGIVAGYFGGVIDSILSRIIEGMMSIPTFFLILTILAFISENPVFSKIDSMYYVMIVIGFTRWTSLARIVRGQVMSIKEQEFVLSARAIGASHSRIIFRHILPNTFTMIAIYFTLGISGAILTESALSFLGIGIKPPIPTWGSILSEGRETIEYAAHLSIFPGIAIFLAVMGFNLLGEGIREILDPRTKRT